jgi:transposase
MFPTGDTAMAMGRPKAEMALSAEQQGQLQSLARPRSLPAALSLRAKFVVACAAGAPNSSIAQHFETTNATVNKWRQRFVERRIAGLYDELRAGKPRPIDDERVAALINTTVQTKPARGATHWSVRTAAKAAVGVDVERRVPFVGAGTAGGVYQAAQGFGIVQAIAAQVDPSVQEQKRAAQVGAVEQDGDHGEALVARLAVEREAVRCQRPLRLPTKTAAALGRSALVRGLAASCGRRSGRVRR